MEYCVTNEIEKKREKEKRNGVTFTKIKKNKNNNTNKKNKTDFGISNLVNYVYLKYFVCFLFKIYCKFYR